MKKLLAIVVLGLLLAGCVATNEIGIYNDIDTPNYRVKKLQYDESKTFKFKKNYAVTVAALLNYNKHQENCTNIRTSAIFYKKYTSCLNNAMKVEDYIFEVNNFKNITEMHTLLFENDIYTQEKSFALMNFILEMPLNYSKSKTFEEDFKLIEACKFDQSFSSFAKCLDSTIRNQEIYLNSNSFTRSTLEQIIGYTLIYSKFLETDKSILNKIKFPEFFYKNNLDKKPDQKLFLSSLLDYYASNYYENKIDNLIVNKNNFFEPSIFQVKKEQYFKSVKNKTSKMTFYDVVDAAYYVYLIYDYSSGGISKTKQASKKVSKATGSSSKFPTDSTSSYRKNMFRHAPANSVLKKSWFKYHILK